VDPNHHYVAYILVTDSAIESVFFWNPNFYSVRVQRRYRSGRVEYVVWGLRCVGAICGFFFGV
jgi:hypothetical protein